MIKDVEVAMVHAANYALDYQDKKYNADIEEIIKQFLNKFNFDIKSELKIYSVAAINEIIKMKIKSRNKSKKQLIQMFTNKIPEISRRIKEEESE
jgi:hypothetical protein